MTFGEWYDSTYYGKNTHLAPTKELTRAAWNAGLDEAWSVVQRYLAAYPESIFKQPPAGQHGETVDACSAAALRSVLPNIIEDIKELES